MKILIVANNCNKWDSWDEKLQMLEDWFLPATKIDFEVIHTYHDHIPFVQDIFHGQGHNMVDGLWYNQNVTIHAKGFDIVMLVMPMSQWDSPKTRGWRTDRDEGPVELQIGCDENQKDKWPSFPRMSSFFQLARHEICHALYMIKGIEDNTHKYWNMGNLDLALPEIKGPYTRELLITVYYKLINLYEQLIKKIMELETNSQKILKIAKTASGLDASPNDVVADELACAESVSNILRKILPDFPIITGTWTLMDYLSKNKLFKEVTSPSAGTIIISATGTGNGKIRGHVGIFIEGGMIMSNDSRDGLFKANYTLESWNQRYLQLGGFPVRFFEMV